MNLFRKIVARAGSCPRTGRFGMMRITVDLRAKSVYAAARILVFGLILLTRSRLGLLLK